MDGRIIEDDRRYMRAALDLAEIAAQKDEVPIGAVVISPDGKIIGSGYNQTEQLYCQSRHAEVGAIEQAGKELKDWRLIDCTIYVTIQPCLMCISLIGLSRISRVVYGAESPLFGYHLDKESLPSIYKKHIGGISSGVLADETERLIEAFFKEKRE